MKKVFFIFFFIFFFISAKSQNLIPNYSFETYSSCPNAGGQINFASPWINANTGSSDYFHSCGSAGFKTPLNFRGYQYPASGNAYAGIGVYGSIGASSAREYIQVLLSDTLIAGKLYCVSFYVSQCGISSFGGGYNPVAISEIGLLFSNNLINTSNYFPLPYTPQIVSPSGLIIDDTVNWVEISGIYTALGGERYVTIGNFKDDATTDTIAIDTTGSNPQGYYYVDDVSVIDCDSLVGIYENSKVDVFSVYPNPASGQISVEFELLWQENVSIEILNILGQPLVIKANELSQGKQTVILNVAHLPKGVYFIQLKSPNAFSSKKFIKD